MTREPVVYDLWADIREEWLTIAAYENLDKLNRMSYEAQQMRSLFYGLFGTRWL